MQIFVYQHSYTPENFSNIPLKYFGWIKNFTATSQSKI